MRKTVHIIGAGGPAGVGMTRCLKERYDVTGRDISRWSKLMMECQDVEEKNDDMAIPIPDRCVIGHAGDDNAFLPPEEQVLLCQDKAKTAVLLGDLAPTTYWVRDTEGAGGKGRQMASEFLPGSNYSVEFVILDNQILAKFQKRRLSYSVKKVTEGLENAGSSAVSVCTDRQEVFDIALEALISVSGATGTVLNGFYGVDIKCTAKDEPKVTEINAGRLLTASYSYYHLTGYNLPLIGVQAFLGDPVSPLPDYPLGYGIIRQVGQEPRIFPPEVTQEWV